MTSGLYLLTDADLLPGTRLFAAVETVLATGQVAALQYRNKSASALRRYQEALELSRLCADTQTPFIINDDLSLALKLPQAGLHLGQQDGLDAGVRPALGPRLWGVTCHGSIELARTAKALGADYLAFGRFYRSQTKACAPEAPLSVLNQARLEFADCPRIAIGGVSVHNAASLLSAGASHLAVIADVFGKPSLNAMAAQVLAYAEIFAQYADRPGLRPSHRLLSQEA